MSSDEKEGRLPLPIWFFVGVILFVYGILVVVGQAMDPGSNAVRVGTPGYWWGAVLAFAGAIFTAIGLIVHRKQ